MMTHCGPWNYRTGIRCIWPDRRSWKWRWGLSSDALATAEEAVDRARAAGMAKSLGDCAGKADRSRMRDPVLARALMVQGFSQLIRDDATTARASHEEAICRDNLLPLARLGLGLALIRQGDLDGGVAELELAVALDPNVSLYRSYLGKGYLESGRVALARSEFARAKGS